MSARKSPSICSFKSYKDTPIMLSPGEIWDGTICSSSAGEADAALRHTMGESLFSPTRLKSIPKKVKEDPIATMGGWRFVEASVHCRMGVVSKPAHHTASRVPTEANKVAAAITKMVRVARAIKQSKSNIGTESTNFF